MLDVPKVVPRRPERVRVPLLKARPPRVEENLGKDLETRAQEKERPKGATPTKPLSDSHLLHCLSAADAVAEETRLALEAGYAPRMACAGSQKSGPCRTSEPCGHNCAKTHKNT